jgi:putative endonuclease
VWPFGPTRQPPLGQLGEKLGRRFLKRQGLKILASNYRCPAGEIDLIALDRSTARAGGADTICFVEVKTRSSDQYTDPQSAVDDQKRRHVRKAAQQYLAARDAADLNVRFDILAVVLEPGQAPRINHFPGAF